MEAIGTARFGILSRSGNSRSQSTSKPYSCVQLSDCALGTGRWKKIMETIGTGAFWDIPGLAIRFRNQISLSKP